MAHPPRAVLTALREHPRAWLLSEQIARVCLDAAERAEPAIAHRGAEPNLEEVTGVSLDEAQTPFGNVWRILEEGPRTSDAWQLLGAGLASWVLQRPSVDAALLRQCAWLAAHTGCDVWPFLALEAPPGLGQQRAAEVAALPAAEQLALAVGLLDAEGDEARLLKESWREQTPYPSVRRCLDTGLLPEALEGELAPPPRRPWLVALQALSGYLLLRSLLRALARWVLGWNARAALTISSDGLELRHAVTLLGRRWRERRQLLPLSEITSVERDVRYQGASLHAGLFALVVGTYVGSGLLVDAWRVPSGSPSLFGMGLLLVAAGIGLDFALAHWATHREGRVRLTVRRRRGRGLRLQRLDDVQCQRVLQQLARRRGFEPRA